MLHLDGDYQTQVLFFNLNLTDLGNKEVLSGIDIKIHEDELFVIIGEVGSGKSTLLAAILNETTLTSGNIKRKGRIAYVEQEPFILSGTIKDNILFGLPFNQQKLLNAIMVSWLQQDKINKKKYCIFYFNLKKIKTHFKFIL